MMDKQERDKLIMEHLPFVRQIAGRFRAFKCTEDLVHEGILGLIRATDLFDPTRGVKFLTYASYWIKVFIIRYVRKQAEYIPVEDDQMGNLQDMSISADEVAVQQDIREKTIKHLKDVAVTDRDIQIISERYLDPKSDITLREIGEKYGVSRQRIKQIEKRTISKIKKELR